MRLGHLCEYAPDVAQPKPVQAQRKLLPAPVPIWTEADSLRTAYFNAFQRYDPIGLSNSETFAQVIPRESFSDDVFDPICMSLGALSLSTAVRSSVCCGDQYSGPLATSPSSDAVHAKAVRYYSTALSRLRGRLASEGAALSPRALLLSTGALACFELMEGSLVTSWQTQIACLSVLSDVVIAQAQSGDSERFGLTALYKDDLAVEEMEAVQVRLSAMSILGQPELLKRTCRKTVPIPRPAQGKLPQPEAPTELFQKYWNSFARKFESWRLACYWSICLSGRSARLPHFLDDQRILFDSLRSWDKTIRSRIRLSRCLSFDHDHVQALKILLIYVRSMQLFLAPDDEDTQRLESLRATDLADIARLPLRPVSRSIGGFWLGSWNDCQCDSRLFLMIKVFVLKLQCPTASFNYKLAQLQLDHGEAICLTLRQYYEGSRTHYHPGSLPVQTRVMWTLLWWGHYHHLVQTSIDDMRNENHSSTYDTNTSDSDERDRAGSSTRGLSYCPRQNKNIGGDLFT